MEGKGPGQMPPDLEKMIASLNAVVSELQQINSRLTSLVSALQVSQRPTIDEIKRRIVASKLRSQIYELCDSKHSVQDIGKETGKAGPLVTRYLREMEQMGIVASVQEGKRKFYYKVK